jgi:hypothetical protein
MELMNALIGVGLVFTEKNHMRQSLLTLVVIAGRI